MLKRTNNIDNILDAEPINNFTNIDKDAMLDKQMTLISWYRNYELHNVKEEVSKMTELIGKPNFTGTRLKLIQFLIKKYIWCFTLENVKNSLVVIYLSSEGLDIEVTKNCEPYLFEILDELIAKIIVKE